MNGAFDTAAIAVEGRKAAGSRVVLTATVLLVAGIAMLAGSLTWAAASGNEQILAQLGPLADKDGWVRLTGVMAQITAAGGLLGFGRGGCRTRTRLAGAAERRSARAGCRAHRHRTGLVGERRNRGKPHHRCSTGGVRDRAARRVALQRHRLRPVRRPHLDRSAQRAGRPIGRNRMSWLPASTATKRRRRVSSSITQASSLAGTGQEILTTKVARTPVSLDAPEPVHEAVHGHHGLHADIPALFVGHHPAPIGVGEHDVVECSEEANRRWRLRIELGRLGNVEQLKARSRGEGSPAAAG